MATYQYRCTEEQCGHEFEAKQRMTEDPLAVCPQCGGHTQRIITSANFQLKGNNWERDGYGADI